MNHTKSYYDILQINENASPEEIKKAYRRLSYQYHPDKNPNKEEQFKEIGQAYEILKDETMRNQYDFELQMKHGNVSMNNPLDNMMSSFFESMLNKPKGKKKQSTKAMDDFINILGGNMGGFGGMGMSPMQFTDINDMPEFNVYSANIPFNNLQQSPYKDKTDTIEDIHVTEEIEFEDSYHGCCVPIQITRTITRGSIKNSKENEKIYLTIQKGVDNDEIITIQEKGNIMHDKISDIKVHIKVKEHPIFKRNGIHLILPKQVSFKESLTGFNFVLEHLNGSKTKLSSSRGNIIQNGDKKVIKELGFERNDKKGDLIIMFHVNHPPNKLTEEQLQIIEENF